jgi:hypothetical protein
VTITPTATPTATASCPFPTPCLFGNNTCERTPTPTVTSTP